jgi:hypothetical protein
MTALMRAQVTTYCALWIVGCEWDELCMSFTRRCAVLLCIVDRRCAGLCPVECVCVCLCAAY